VFRIEAVNFAARALAAASAGVRRMDGLDRSLLAKANEQCLDPAFRNAVWRHLGYRNDARGLPALSTRIHPRDQMLQHSLRHFHEVNRSLSQYFNVALQQHNSAQQVFRRVLGAPKEKHRLLDFACGYGRLLRFLTLSQPLEESVVRFGPIPK